MFDAWTEQTTMVALGLVAAALVISISLAVQRWLYASTLKKAERDGDNEANASQNEPDDGTLVRVAESEACLWVEAHLAVRTFGSD